MPDEWIVSNVNEYESGFDANQRINNNDGSVYLKTLVEQPREFGFIAKNMDAHQYVGRQLSMTAWVKTAIAQSASSQLWLRVDGDWKNRPDGTFDNMYPRRIIGTQDWRKHTVKVTVPEGSAAIVYGVLLNGQGQIWIDDVAFEVQ